MIWCKKLISSLNEQRHLFQAALKSDKKALDYPNKKIIFANKNRVCLACPKLLNLFLYFILTYIGCKTFQLFVLNGYKKNMLKQAYFNLITL